MSTNETYLNEIAVQGELAIKKSRALLEKLLKEYETIDKIPEEKMKEVHRLANFGGGFLDKKGEIWQHHPH